MSPISCVGCHGREEDMGNDSVSAGRGAGLRQHHAVAGQTGCQNCHSDADPANFTPVGEDVLPEYYANPGTNHPSIPTDSCSPSGEEDIAGLTTGLDNDGDGDVDCDDADCADAIQEALLRAWLQLPKLRNHQLFEHWLVRIVLRECYRITKRRKFKTDKYFCWKVLRKYESR